MFNKIFDFLFPARAAMRRSMANFELVSAQRRLIQAADSVTRLTNNGNDLPFLIGQTKNGTTVYKNKATGKFMKAADAKAYLDAL